MEDAITWKRNMTPESKDLLKKLSEAKPMILSSLPEVDMLGYKSPIEVIMSDMVMKEEDQVMQAVWNVGVNVDKEELVKALAYDRDQYAAGYRYAKEKFDRPHGEWITVCTLPIIQKCSKCGKYREGGIEVYNFCPNCGADMRPKILDQAVDGEGKDGNVKEGDER